MIFLRNKDRYDTLAMLDPETGWFEAFSRSARPNSATVRTQGSYSFLSGVLVALYAQGNAFILQVGDWRSALTET